MGGAFLLQTNKKAPGRRAGCLYSVLAVMEKAISAQRVCRGQGWRRMARA